MVGIVVNIAAAQIQRILRELLSRNNCYNFKIH